MRCYRIVGQTETGPVRKSNEDHILLGRFIKNRGRLEMTIQHDDDYLAGYGLLLAVADGIGGKAGGALASRLALQAFERQFYAVEKGDGGLEVYAEVVHAAAARANETLLQVVAKRPELTGMGCTLSGVCLTPHGYLVFNAGDSRVYRFRHLLTLLTRDDTVTELRASVGGLTYAEAEASDARHTLTNCLGSEDFRLAMAPGRELRDNDRLLICSDGLHDLVKDDEMNTILGSSSSLEVVCSQLANGAIANGGQDNISLILVHSDVEEKEDLQPLTANMQIDSHDSSTAMNDQESGERADVQQLSR
jgi:PPM family protein phosphatase